MSVRPEGLTYNGKMFANTAGACPAVKRNKLQTTVSAKTPPLGGDFYGVGNTRAAIAARKAASTASSTPITVENPSSQQCIASAAFAALTISGVTSISGAPSPRGDGFVCAHLVPLP
jgi:hypothetical protein